MEIIENYSNSYEGNDCIIHKSAIVGYIPEKGKYLVIEVKYYQGSWTSDNIGSATQQVDDEKTARKIAQKFVMHEGVTL